MRTKYIVGISLPIPLKEFLYFHTVPLSLSLFPKKFRTWFTVGQNLDSFRNASKLVHVDSRAPVEPKENVCGRADISVAPA